MSDQTATVTAAETKDTQLEKALEVASKPGAAERLSADAEHRAADKPVDSAARTPEAVTPKPELVLGQGRDAGSTDASPSRLSELENGTVGAELAKLFKWLPPIGSEDNPECRLGNRLHDYFNATSDFQRSQALEQLKKEAMLQGSAKALDLLQTTATFDAAVSIIEAKKNMADSPSASLDKQQRALTDLAALAAAGIGPAETLLEKVAGTNSQAFRDQANREASLRAEATAKNINDLAAQSSPSLPGDAEGAAERKDRDQEGKPSDAEGDANQRQSFLLGEKNLVHIKQWAEAASAVKETANLDRAAGAVVKLSTLSAAGNPEAKQLLGDLIKSGAVPDLSLICNDRQQLQSELSDPTVLERLKEELKPTQAQLADLANLSPWQILSRFGIDYTPSDALPDQPPPVVQTTVEIGPGKDAPVVPGQPTTPVEAEGGQQGRVGNGDAAAKLEADRRNLYKNLGLEQDSNTRQMMQRMACAGPDGQHPTGPWKAAREIYGYDQTAAGMLFPGGESRIDDAAMRFMIGKDDQRQAVLKSLEDWTMEGDPSALCVLNRLAMVDAVTRLRTAKNGDDERKALRDLAALELSGQEQNNASGLLDHFPNATDSANGRQTTKEERQEMVTQARREAREEKVGFTTRTNELIVQAASGSPQQRGRAMEQLNQAVRENAFKYADTGSLLKAYQKLTVENAVLDILHTDDPSKIEGDIQKILPLQNNGAATDQAKTVMTLLGDVDGLQAKLADPDQADAAGKQIKDSLSQLAEGTDRDAKSATDILSSFKDPKEVDLERQEAHALEKENWTKADTALGKILDRNATAEDREKALADLKQESQSCLRQFRSTKFNGVLAEVEGTNEALNLRDCVQQAIKSENSDGLPDAESKAAVLEALQKLEDKSKEATGYGAGSYAYSYLEALGKPEELQNLVAKLNAGTAKDQVEALKVLQTKLEDLPHNLDRLRTGRILAGINEKSSPQEFSDAVKKLTDESAAGNKLAQEWKPWTSTAAVVAGLNNASTAEQARAAMAELVTEAKGGNAYARQELAGVLLANDNQGQAQKWMRSGGADLNGHPTFVPQLSDALLDSSHRLLAEVKLTAAKELAAEINMGESNLMQQGDKALGAPLSKGEAGAMSMALAEAYAGKNQDLVNVLKPVLATALQGHGPAEVEDGLFQAISTNNPGTQNLAKLYLEGVWTPTFSANFAKIQDLARFDNDAAMKVMAGAVAGGATASPDANSTDGAKRFFDRISADDQASGRAITALIDIYGELQPTGDRGKLLATLGKLSDKNDGAITDRVRSLLTRGLNAPTGPEHTSATEGMVALADKWQAKDVQTLIDHIDPSLAPALRQNLDHIPREMQKELAEGLGKYIDTSAQCSALKRKNAIQALSVLAKDSTPAQVAMLEKYGDPDLKGVAGRDKLSKDDVNDLRTAAGYALISVMGKSDSCKEKAFDSFSKVDWPNIDSNKEQYDLLKNTLKDYASGRPFDLEAFEKLNNMTYESGLTRPIASILKNWNVPAAGNDDLFQKAQLCTQNASNLIEGLSGEDTVRRIAENIDLLNTLTPEARASLGLGFEERINPVQVVGLLENGHLKDSPFGFLLDNWSAKAKDIRDDLARQAAAAGTKVDQIDKVDRPGALNELADQTRQGVSVVDRLGYVAVPAFSYGLMSDDTIDKFDARQSELVHKLKDCDRSLVDARAQKATIDRNLAVMDLATKVGEHTDLANSGQQRQADELAAGELWSEHGSMLKQFAPSVWRDLGPSAEGRSGRSAVKRLHDAGEAPYAELPKINNFQDALGALRGLSNHPYTAGEKPAGYEQQLGVEKAALEQIDGDKNLSQLSKTANDMGPSLESLGALINASTNGTKYQDLVDLMKSDSQQIQKAMDGFDQGTLGDIRSEIVEMKALANDPNVDGRARQDLLKRIDSYSGMADLMDPNSAKHKQVMEMLDKIDDPNFRADTFGNWVKQNGPVLGATVVAVAATVAACASCGVTSPLAVAAWCSVSALAASEITKETLYQINSSGYTGWGTYGERSRVGKWSEDIDKRTVLGNLVSFEGDVVLQYEKQVAIDTALAFATMGISKFATEGTSAFSGRVMNELIFGNAAADQLASQVERVGMEAGAKSASGQFMREYMGKFGQELMTNAGLTGAQVSAEALAQKVFPEYMKEGSPTFSFGLSTALAIGQGLLHMRAGAGRTMHYEGNTADVEHFYERQGHTVHDLGAGRLEVIPFDAPPGDPGFVLDRGTGLPPADVFPSGRGPSESATPNRPEPANQIGRDTASFSDQFMQGKFDSAVKTAQASIGQVTQDVQYKPVLVDCNAIAKAPAGSNTLPDLLGAMGDYGRAQSEGGKLSSTLPKPVLQIDPNCQVSILEPGKTVDGRPLTPAQQAKVNEFIGSKSGQRILAEQALIAMEENLHLHALKEPGNTSTSFEKLRQAQGASGLRSADSYEQEAILALHDADPKKWDSDMLRRHFGQQHADAREPVFQYIEQLEGKRAAGPLPRPAEASPALDRTAGQHDGQTPEPVNLGRQDNKLPLPARVAELAKEGCTTFQVKDKANDLMGAEVQQAVFKGLEDMMRASKPGQPSLADQGWEIIQSHKNSAGDQAKMDFVLINKKTGDYHLIDATADPNKFNRTGRSQILKDAIILIDPKTDLDYGQLTKDGLAKVTKRLEFLAGKNADLNIITYPPPTFEKPNKLDDASRQMEEFRNKLSNSDNPELRNYARSLQGGQVELDRHEIEQSPEWQGQNKIVQTNVDSLCETAIRDLLNGKTALSKDIDLDRIKPDRKGGTTKFDMDLEDKGRFRIERDTDALDKQFDQVFKKMMKNAEGAPDKQTALIAAKQKYSPEEVMRRVQILASEAKVKNLVRDPNAPPPPKFDKDKAAADLAAGSCADLNVAIDPTLGYNPDMKEALNLALEEAQTAAQKARPEDTANRAAAADALRKIVDSYQPDSPEDVARINETIQKSMDERKAASASPDISLGRNDDSLSATKKSIADTTISDTGKAALTAMAEASERGENLARTIANVPEAARTGAGIDAALANDVSRDDLALRTEYAQLLSQLDSASYPQKAGLESLIRRSQIKDGGEISEDRLHLVEKLLSMSPAELKDSGAEWCLSQKRVEYALTKRTVDAYQRRQEASRPRGMEFKEVPDLNLAETKELMDQARIASGEKPVDLAAVLEDHKYQKAGRRGDYLAAALEETDFYKQFKDSITGAEVLSEGNESVVLKVKGPFVVGEDDNKVTVPEMVLKISQPLRGAWDEDWGNWQERPWDAMMVSHETVTANNDRYEVYLQELVQPGVSPADQKKFEGMVHDWNYKHQGSKDDRYEVWDTDARGDATKQFGYSSLPVSPELEAGCLWVTVNGQRMRVVVVDPWTVCKYGVDGKKE